jgi:hypothetical protein
MQLNYLLAFIQTIESVNILTPYINCRTSLVQLMTTRLSKNYYMKSRSPKKTDSKETVGVLLGWTMNHSFQKKLALNHSWISFNKISLF